MKVPNINPITHHISFCAASTNKPLRTCATQNYTQKPLPNALSTAGAWFGFGIALDFVSRKFQFTKSPTKNSLIINGIIAAGAGLYTGIKSVSAKK